MAPLDNAGNFVRQALTASVGTSDPETISVTDAAAGEITVTIDSGVTDGLAGRYQHEVRVTDQDGDTAVVTEGRVRIADRVTP
jgi:hypothetical protein